VDWKDASIKEMGNVRVTFDRQKRLSYKVVFPVVRGWQQRLVQIEQHQHVNNGTITGASEDTGTLELSTVINGEGKKTLRFELASADFEQFAELGDDFSDAFMVYPPAGDWLILRKWKA
jgi:hypothetical protein